MKLKINVIIAIFFSINLISDCIHLKAQTTVAGGVVNGTWTLAGSPYQVQGSIQIVNGDSLTIEPGVTVNFHGTYKLLVLGKLKAIGTITDTITFTAADTTTGWRGIRFDNTPTTNDTSRITYCKIQYGKATGISPEDAGGGLYFDNYSKVVVSHSLITKCTAKSVGAGICVNYSSPLIMNNTISNNRSASASAYGIGIYIFYGNPYIANNIIDEKERH